MGSRIRIKRSRLLVALAPIAAIALGSSTPLRAQGQSGPESPADAAVQVLVDLFDGMRSKDEALLRRVWHPAARLLTAPSSPDAELRETPIDRFIEGVLGSPAQLDEVIFDVVVQVDGGLASIWAPYNLFVDGAFQHCGVDAVQLVQTAEGWRITQLTDTRTQDGCDPARRGS
jgi:hypothetical protein